MTSGGALNVFTPDQAIFCDTLNIPKLRALIRLSFSFMRGGGSCLHWETLVVTSRRML